LFQPECPSERMRKKKREKGKTSRRTVDFQKKKKTPTHQTKPPYSLFGTWGPRKKKKEKGKTPAPPKGKKNFSGPLTTPQLPSNKKKKKGGGYEFRFASPKKKEGRRRPFRSCPTSSLRDRVTLDLEEKKRPTPVSSRKKKRKERLSELRVGVYFRYGASKRGEKMRRHAGLGKLWGGGGGGGKKKGKRGPLNFATKRERKKRGTILNQKCGEKGTRQSSRAGLEGKGQCARKGKKAFLPS